MFLQAVAWIFFVVVSVMLCTDGASAQEVRGYNDIQSALQTIPTGGRVRIIVEVNVDPALIPTLGSRNAVARSVETAMARFAQVPLSIIEPIPGTARIVTEVNANELTQLNQLGIVS